MNKIVGLRESFQKAKVLYMITFGEKGEEHSRPMTNFNDDPYNIMWFTTYTNTQKVEDIKNNDRTLILFPSEKEGEFYEISGHSEFEKPEVVKEKWQWWFLYWHPDQKPMYWFSNYGKHPERCIINFFPESARTLHVSDIEYISRPYKSILEKRTL
jgi:general stress protein 26